MAFQLADDLLDYIGDPQITGKPIGSDLRDGRATLPFLLGMERANEHDVCILRSAFADTSLTDRGVQKICDLLSKYRVFESVRSEAQEFVLGSAEVLSRLPNTEAKSGLLALTDYVVQRNR